MSTITPMDEAGNRTSKRPSRKSILQTVAPAIVSAALLFGSPFAYAQTVEVNGTIVNTVADLVNGPPAINYLVGSTPATPTADILHAGVVLRDGVGYYATSPLSFGNTSQGVDGYKISGDLNLTNFGPRDGVVAAMTAVNIEDGKSIGFNDINIKGEASDALYGFLYVAENFFPQPGGDSIVGGNVTVNNTYDGSTGGWGDAYGVRFINVDTTVPHYNPFFNPFYSPGGASCRAINPKETITFDTIDVASECGYAYGLESGGMKANSTLTVNKIIATSYGDSGGLGAAAYGLLMDTIDDGAFVTVTDIIARTEHENAFESIGLYLMDDVSGNVVISGNVHATTKGDWAEARGVSIGIITSTGVVDLNRVTASTEGDGKATGLDVGTNTARLSFSHLKTPMIEGTLRVRSVEVIATGNGDAVGLDIGGMQGDAYVEVGRVDVRSGDAETQIGGNAWGVWLHDEGELTLTGDITAVTHGTGTNAIGVYFGADSTVNLGNNIVVTAICDKNYGAGFVALGAGDATINLDKYTLITCSTNASGSSTLSGGINSFIVTGTGAANLGVMDMQSDNLLIGTLGETPTAVAFNIGRGTFLGHDHLGGSLPTTYTIDPGTQLVVYGNAFNRPVTDPTINPVAANGRVDTYPFYIDVDEPPTLLSRSIFTDYYFDYYDLTNPDPTLGWGIYARSRGDVAVMSDGYLAAMKMHNGYTGWRAVRNHLISGSGVPMFRKNACDDGVLCGQAPCKPAGVAPCDPRDRFDFSQNFLGRLLGLYEKKDRGAWVNYVNRSDQFDSVSVVNDNWRFNSEGIQFGTDLLRTRNSQVGLHFGYEEGRMNNTNWFGRTDWVRGEDFYFGVYGARVLRGGFDVRGVLTFGQQDYNMLRWGADDLTTYSTAFKGHTTEVNLEVGRRMLFPDRWTSFVDRKLDRLHQKIWRSVCSDKQATQRLSGLWTYRPVVAMDVFNSNLRGAAENDDDLWRMNQSEAVIYDRASLTQVYLRTGTDLQYQLGGLLLSSGLYYSYDVNGQPIRARVTALEDTHPLGNENFYAGVGPLSGILSSPKLGRSLLSFNVGGSCKIGSCMTVFASYQGEYATDRAESQIHSVGQAGMGYRW